MVNVRIVTLIVIVLGISAVTEMLSEAPMSVRITRSLLFACVMTLGSSILLLPNKSVEVRLCLLAAFLLPAAAVNLYYSSLTNPKLEVGGTAYIASFVMCFIIVGTICGLTILAEMLYKKIFVANENTRVVSMDD